MAIKSPRFISDFPSETSTFTWGFPSQPCLIPAPPKIRVERPRMACPPRAQRPPLRFPWEDYRVMRQESNDQPLPYRYPTIRAMEHPLWMEVLIEQILINRPFSIAMFDYQRVNGSSKSGLLDEWFFTSWVALRYLQISNNSNQSWLGTMEELK